MNDPGLMHQASCRPPGADRPLPRRGPRAWLVVLAGLVIVAGGAVIGAGVTMLVLHHNRMPPPPPGPQTAATLAADLQDRLDLTDEQARQVKEVMTRRMEAIKTILDDGQTRMQAEHEKLRAEMKAILTPEQFNRWESRFDAARPPGFPPPRGPGGPPPGRGPMGDGPGMSPPGPEAGPWSSGFGSPGGPPDAPPKGPPPDQGHPRP